MDHSRVLDYSKCVTDEEQERGYREWLADQVAACDDPSRLRHILRGVLSNLDEFHAQSSKGHDRDELAKSIRQTIEVRLEETKPEW